MKKAKGSGKKAARGPMMMPGMPGKMHGKMGKMERMGEREKKR